MSIAVMVLAPGWAFALPTAEERKAFFTEQRRQKAVFEGKILEDTNSRVAAARSFDAKEKSDRIAFNQSLLGMTPGDKSQRLLDYNASARKRRSDFEKSLAGKPKGKYEKQLDDFDKKTDADLKALAASLAEADPALRAETFRQAMNTSQLRRAQLSNSIQTEVRKAKSDFNRSRSQQVRSFFQE